MDAGSLQDIATELLPPDRYVWTVEWRGRGSVFTASSTTGLAEALELLDSGTGAFVLSIGDRITHAEYGYDAAEERVVIREQLGRVRAYLDGAVTLAEEIHGDRLISTRADFPDGLTITMNHAGLTSFINRIFGTAISSSRAEYRD